MDSSQWTSVSRGCPDYGQLNLILLILDADFYGDIIKPDLIKPDSSTPLPQLIIFGWIISAPASVATTNINESYHFSVDYNLQNLLTKFRI